MKNTQTSNGRTEPVCGILNFKIQDVYERIVFWKENLFMLPAGAAAKNPQQRRQN